MSKPAVHMIIIIITISIVMIVQITITYSNVNYTGWCHNVPVCNVKLTYYSAKKDTAK